MFDITPNMDGVARYSDPYTIEFVPEKWFKSGEKYNVVFDLKSIIPDVPKGFEEFTFDFNTILLDYNVIMKGLIKTVLTKKLMLLVRCFLRM